MRAREIIVESASQNPLDGELVTNLAKTWIWRITPDLFEQMRINSQAAYRPIQPVPPGANHIWWLGFKKEPYAGSDDPVQYPHMADVINRWPYFLLVTVQNGDLVTLGGSPSMMTTVMFKKLAQVTQAQNAPDIPSHHVNNQVLYQGKVQPVADVLALFRQPDLHNKARVYAIPRDTLWAVGSPGESTWDVSHEWDTNWKIADDLRGVTLSLKVQGNKLVSANAAIPELITELAQRENWQIMISVPTDRPMAKKKTIKPNSVMHQMLAYINENPGASRTDWFVKHMNYAASGMPSWSSDKSWDGAAARLGWIRNDDGVGIKYNLSITPTGKLVLARLAAGRTVTYTAHM
jgi:hypothetical protein